jgi:hypothetical protein
MIKIFITILKAFNNIYKLKSLRHTCSKPINKQVEQTKKTKKITQWHDTQYNRVNICDIDNLIITEMGVIRSMINTNNYD